MTGAAQVDVEVASSERLTSGKKPSSKRAQELMRPEIQGLRAGAVMLVLLFHLWPSRLTGGYIGVDVFFVISGYLITKHLLNEIELSGRLSVTKFWARRAKRLLPASLLVLTLTAVATFAYVPQSLWKQFFRELLASALYVQNWRLALDAVDYLAAANEPSALQHFWTLSVEEQFYFALPILLLTVSATNRRCSLFSSTRRALLVTILTLASGSFIYSVWFTLTEPLIAYFSTATRAWEFGSGAALAFVATRARPLVCQLAAWAGLAFIIVGAHVFDRSTSFPGIAALLPVLGTVAIIWAGDSGSRFEPASLARWRPVQLLGNISYSVYLWHWPMIVMAPLVLERALGPLDKIAIVVVSIAMAAATTRWLEDPIRFATSHSPGVVAIWSIAGMAGIIVLARAGVTCIEWAERASAAQVADLVAQDPPCLGAKAMRPRAQPCVNPTLHGVIVPNPALVAADVVRRPDCRVTGSRLRVCSVGPKTGYTKRLAALGDSHNAALLPAYEAIAAAANWRIDVAAKNACYWTSSVQHKSSPADLAACEAWKASLNQRLAVEEPYDAIIVTHGVSRFQPEAAPGEDQQAEIVKGLVDAWKTQVERGTQIIAIRDNPVAMHGTTACVARHLLRANDFCSLPRAQALSTFDGHIAATRALPGSHLIDLSDYYCDPDRCLTIIGNVVVYRDADHLTVTFARTLAPVLLDELRKILGSPT